VYLAGGKVGLWCSDAASALKGGEAVPAGDWSEAETLERIASEVAILPDGSGGGFFFLFFFIRNLSFCLLWARDGMGSVRHSCKKLQASVKAWPEITQFAVFVHIINPTGFFVYDFDCFSRLKSTYRWADGKHLVSTISCVLGYH
jgi:hypothetical protein